jgi:hypothetical protein
MAAPTLSALEAAPWRGMTSRCGKPMPMRGDVCWRRPGHKDACRSQYAIEDQNRQRRKWPLEQVAS